MASRAHLQYDRIAFCYGRIMAIRLMEADVVVVGAGLAGLVAATELKRAGLDVVVLEARDRVGGRLLNHDLGNGEVAELGGEWFGRGSTAIMDFAKSRGARWFANYDDGEKLLVTEEGITRYTGALPKLGGMAVADFALAAKRIDRMAGRVPHGEPWAAPNAAEWDSQTFWSWIRRNTLTRNGRRMLELWAHAVVGGGSNEFSLLHALYYARASGGFEATVAVRGGQQEFRFVGGAQGLTLSLADELGERVSLTSPVRTITQDAERVVASGDGFAVTALRLICAAPVSLAGRITYKPALPQRRDQLAQRMPPGSMIKCIAIYSDAFWRAQGLSGQAYCLDDSPTRAVLDTSPPGGTPGVLTVFVGGPAARAMTRLHPSERRETLLARLAHFFGPAAGRPEQFVEQNWMEEEWTRGCYHGMAQCGVYTAVGPALRERVGRIHWAGSESGAHAMGSMGGAVDSAQRVTGELIATTR